jgi:hypothetical protein
MLNSLSTNINLELKLIILGNLLFLTVVMICISKTHLNLIISMPFMKRPTIGNYREYI